MTAKGHVVLATTLSYPVVSFYLIENYSIPMVMLMFAFMILGSLLPDIDEPNSYIGNRAKLLSYALKVIGIKHRTITHWLIFPLLIALLAYFLDNSIATPLLYSLAFGVLAHDIGDMLTKGGINGFFYPLFPSTKIAILPRFLRFQTFSFIEYIIVLFLFFFNAYIYLKLSILGEATFDSIQKLFSI